MLYISFFWLRIKYILTLELIELDSRVINQEMTANIGPRFLDIYISRGYSNLNEPNANNIRLIELC